MSSRLPSLKPREVLRALERAGFYIHHTGPGSHVQLKHHTDPTKRVTVPGHQGFDMPRGTLRSILKQAGMTPEEFAGYL